MEPVSESPGSDFSEEDLDVEFDIYMPVPESLAPTPVTGTLPMTSMSDPSAPETPPPSLAELSLPLLTLLSLDQPEKLQTWSPLLNLFRVLS